MGSRRPWPRRDEPLRGGGQSRERFRPANDTLAAEDDATTPVLEFAQRRSVYAIMVIDVPHAFIGIHERTAVLISRSALKAVSEDELRAALAHETAHEYVHAEYQRAMVDARRSRLQDLELVCDIIAVTILGAIGQGARSLPAVIEKLQRFNSFHFRLRSGSRLPDILLRRSLILALDKRLATDN